MHAGVQDSLHRNGRMQAAVPAWRGGGGLCEEPARSGARASELTETLGGGSQTAVMPAARISRARLPSTAYHAGCCRCAHSQLKPCARPGKPPNLLLDFNRTPS
jgi:hypothetical protein